MTCLNAINEQINGFKSHSLLDLDKSVLMDRIDTKFILSIDNLLQLLNEIRPICSVLEIDEKRISQYENKYFDTEDLRFYREHHNGGLNRYKVRFRTYLEQSRTFLEVKKKNNKSRTIKTRIPINQPSLENLINNQPFIYSCGVNNSDELQEVQQCNYDRIAFANEKQGERLTIDFNLSYRDKNLQSPLQLEGLVIVELKQNSLNRTSSLFSILRKRKLQMCNLSKYCIGMNLLRENNIKNNRFKQVLLLMKKVTNTYQHNIKKGH